VRPWKYYLFLAMVALMFFSGVRLLFFYLNNHELVDHPPVESLIIGLRFDVSVVCYWLLPALLFNILALPKLSNKRRQKIETTYISTGFCFLLLIGVADVGWYNYYFNHLNPIAFNYSKNPGEALGFIWTTPGFRMLFWLFLLGIAVWLGYCYLLNRLLPFAEIIGKKRYPMALAYCSVAFVGMRGNLTGKPLDLPDVRFCPNDFFNEVAVNPAYYLYKNSFRKTALMSMDKELAYRNFRAEQLNVGELSLMSNRDSAIFKGKNVVLIIMESMGRGKVADSSLTPFLQTLKKESLYFDSFFSSGEHTQNGVFATLTGQPGIMGNHMLRVAEKMRVQTLPALFKKQGYFNIFHLPGSPTFDNISRFLREQQFDSITNYTIMPKDLQSDHFWGTHDHLLFNYALRNLDFLHGRKKPFFSTILTISDHSPIDIPSVFPKESRTGIDKKDITRYADWSLGNFFDSAKRKPWFNNTVFVLVGDHGYYNGMADCPLTMKLHHIPFFIYAPGTKLPKKTVNYLGEQPDILPTLAWLTGLEKPVDAWGTNLLRRKRNFVQYFSDTKIGLFDGQHLHIIDEFGYASSHDPEDGYCVFLGEKELPPNTNQMRQKLLEWAAAQEYFIQKHSQLLPN
jgi:phosphoglycerol transferase MdoB-like AlkP superfamily enzyme